MSGHQGHQCKLEEEEVPWAWALARPRSNDPADPRVPRPGCASHIQDADGRRSVAVQEEGVIVARGDAIAGRVPCNHHLHACMHAHTRDQALKADHACVHACKGSQRCQAPIATGTRAQDACPLCLQARLRRMPTHALAAWSRAGRGHAPLATLRASTSLAMHACMGQLPTVAGPWALAHSPASPG